MIIDKLTKFCGNTALNTGAPGSFLIGDVVPLGQLRDIGQGTALYLVIVITGTATSGGAATASFSLVSDDVAAINPATGTKHITSPVLAVANMPAGKTVLAVALPVEGAEYEEYLGIVQTTAGVAFTGGTVDAFLTPTLANWKAYADGVN